MSVDAVDVFCERGVFSVEQSHSILQAARRLGFLLNFHADELNPLGGAEVSHHPLLLLLLSVIKAYICVLQIFV